MAVPVVPYRGYRRPTCKPHVEGFPSSRNKLEGHASVSRRSGPSLPSRWPGPAARTANRFRAKNVLREKSDLHNRNHFQRIGYIHPAQAPYHPASRPAARFARWYGFGRKRIGPSTTGPRPRRLINTSFSSSTNLRLLGVTRIWFERRITLYLIIRNGVQ